MAWVQQQFSKTQIDKAGGFIISTPPNDPRRNHALNVMHNWRSCHAYPLNTIQLTLRKRARRLDPTAIVAQRLKRLTSIEGKLKRFSLRLSQMNDIGGCRAVVSDVGQVEALHKIYRDANVKNPHRSQVVADYDYIAYPKGDGYRGIHLILKYQTTAGGPSGLAGLEIEVQLRSRLQHLWATAVEVVSTYTGQQLKANIGEESWKRFFLLMSSAMAIREMRPCAPNTPTDPAQLTEELFEVAAAIKLEDTLRAYQVGFSHMEQYSGADQFILVLDTVKRIITVHTYTAQERDKAMDEYLAIEKQVEGQPHIQAVLVSVDSITKLQEAYPNYWMDTSEFLATFYDALSLTDTRPSV